MPVKRRKSKLKAVQVTDEAIDAFKLCEAIIAAGDDQEWEDEGGRRREYLDADRALTRALGLKPWEASPSDVGEDPCVFDGTLYAASWPRAQELRREILAALGRRNDHYR